MIKALGTPLSALLLVTASLLSACGSVSTPAGRAPQRLPSSFKYLHTLSIAPSVSQADLEQRYGGKVLAYWPDQSQAILASNALTLEGSGEQAEQEK